MSNSTETRPGHEYQQTANKGHRILTVGTGEDTITSYMATDVFNVGLVVFLLFFIVLNAFVKHVNLFAICFSRYLGVKTITYAYHEFIFGRGN